ncbi:MAG: ATP-binding cassette domain-containing protein [Anaeroplasmataceae bacterium]|nr:ATP-binding cassette domain-containing protein [Anaeroplasmataceae bacterium]
MPGEKILEVKDLKISFKTDHGLVQAVRGVSFDLSRGETLCIVGESGSGKSVTSKTIMGLLANNAIIEGGSVTYQGENLLEVSEEEFHRIRGHKIGMIFQDPLSSLNPIVRIGKQITEAMLINSNRIKLKYESLIADELTAYKNSITKRKIRFNKEKEHYDLAVKEYKSKLANCAPEEKESLKNLLAEEKAKYVANVSAIKNDTEEKNHIAELKEVLQNRKKEAKAEVAEYKSNLKQEFTQKYAQVSSDADAMITSAKSKYDNRLLELSASKASLSPEDYAEKLDSAKSEYQAVVKEWNDKKAAVKNDYISSLKITKKEAKARALEIMREVGIPMPERRFKQYPFEFSGGMRQRIVIAIALTATPEILICDEPTTALDVTIQAQILELIKKIQKERNIACIFITHDLGVVANMADRVAVMYAGRIVEYGKVEEIFYEPKHPYTWALLSSVPDVDSKERLVAIPGTPPDMIYPPKGDAFALRSNYAMQIDFEHEPPFFKISDTHYAATWLLHPDAPKVEMPKIVSERIKNALKGQAPEENQKPKDSQEEELAAKPKTSKPRKKAVKEVPSDEQ